MGPTENSIELRFARAALRSERSPGLSQAMCRTWNARREDLIVRTRHNDRSRLELELTFIARSVCLLCQKADIWLISASVRLVLRTA